MVIEKFRKLWESNDAGGLAELYSEDSLLDMNMPGWRFQLQGPEAISRQIAGYFERGPVKVLDWRARTSDWGAVVEESTDWEVDPEGLFLPAGAHLPHGRRPHHRAHHLLRR